MLLMCCQYIAPRHLQIQSRMEIVVSSVVHDEEIDFPARRKLQETKTI